MDADLQLRELTAILAIGCLRLLAAHAKSQPQAKLQLQICDSSPCYKRLPEA